MSSTSAPGRLRILIVGLIRNGEATLDQDRARITAAVRPLGDVRWFVVESDSTDATVSKLGATQATDPTFRFTSLGALRERLPRRTHRIAHCRNEYLAEIRRNPDYAAVDLVVVADLDGINCLLNDAAVASCLERDDWDVCTANQRGPYYDGWALRHPEWSPNDCWRQYHFLTEHGLPSHRAMFAAIESRMVTISEHRAWIEVESAFSGLAIYKRPLFDEGTYNGVSDVGGEVCEHVSFHNQLRTSGAKIFINPKLINAGYTQHSRDLTPARAFLLSARRILSLQST